MEIQELKKILAILSDYDKVLGTTTNPKEEANALFALLILQLQELGSLTNQVKDLPSKEMLVLLQQTIQKTMFKLGEKL